MISDWRNDSVQKSFYGIAAISFVVLILLINYWLVTGLWTGTAETWLVQTMFASITIAAVSIGCAIVRKIYLYQFHTES